MSDLLDRIQREIRERLAASRAAVLEYERLERALHALADVGSRASHAVGRRGGAEQGAAAVPQGSSAPAAEPPARSSGRRGATGARSGRSRSARATARQRAPRGANREAVLRVVGERPGVSANELAAVSGVTGGTLYGLLRTLAQRGEIEKRELPGGQTGYQLASGQAAGAPAPVGRAQEAESSAPADRVEVADSSASASGDTPSGAGQPDEAAATAAEETDT